MHGLDCMHCWLGLPLAPIGLWLTYLWSMVFRARRKKRDYNTQV